MFAAIMAERLTNSYFHADQVTFPEHQLVWLWVGCMAMVSPIGLVIFRKAFTRREKEAIKEAEDFAAQQKGTVET